ncbi:hypothetical protein KFU94_28320 [Chloroflexi bacterium TSY]|nr:hypothetical protein [Chloroflexi bacterium TSY]
MAIATIQPIPQLHRLPKTLPLENAVRLELEEGIPVFRATYTVQNRIESLLDKQKKSSLTTKELEELDLYEEVDDYLSFVNRTIRNQLLPRSVQDI